MIRRFGDGRDWFFEKRFGMFVHWGIYAIPAWHEQILWRGTMTRQEYERLPAQFNPTKFDPEQWLDLLQEAGMEYLCFTTKHHDGFCMWETKQTDYSIMHTPYKKDVLAMLAESCSKRGINLGLYYSLPDWHHPNYPNQGRHHEMFGPRPGDMPDEQRYLDFVRRQVEELCTNYGKIYEFFWDVNVAELWDPSLNDLVRGLQPQALINNRGPGPGDYATPERHVPEGKEFTSPTEANQSMGRESWGFREDEDYYSHKFLMQSIDKILAMGGNYLLNVGPKADGTLPTECAEGLKRIGKWYRTAKEAFAGTIPCSSMLSTPETHLFRYDDLLLTRRGNTFYVHLYADPQTNGVVLAGIDKEPSSVVLLNNGQSLSWAVDVIPWRWKEKPCLRIRGLPVNEILDEVMIIRLEFPETVAK
ncbi:MAG TPA: alpha-L-fucosidase [Spirochaetia bacterium]|nr:alpha-L-fucosidase [Spirochaetia bacterium]